VSDPSRNQRAIVGRAMLASAVIMFALAAAFGFDAIPINQDAKTIVVVIVCVAGALDAALALRFLNEPK
jgi:hypothetical protein